MSQSNQNQRKPFELIDFKGSDLEVGTFARLDNVHDYSGIDKFLRTKEQRINDPLQ